MELRGLLLFAFGLTMASGQITALTGGAVSGTPVATPTIVPSEKCPRAPEMPATFSAKRQPWTLRNTISFHDGNGQEFAHVESWLIDWKNPFGYPGATLYLNEAPKVDKTVGFLSKSSQGAANATKERTMIATLTGKRKVDGVFSNEVLVSDCHGDRLAEARNGDILARKYKVSNGLSGSYGREAAYNMKMGDSENVLKITDFGSPVTVLARLEMENPCWPSAPFCQRMGKENWFMHGDEWKGQIVMPGYNSTLTQTPGGFQVVNTAGVEVSMEFLTLYSAYVFSNTRFSKVAYHGFGGLTCILVGLGCCCCCRGRKKTKEDVKDHVKASKEETEKLMKTAKTEIEAPPPKKSIWSCCSRNSGGRTVAPAHH